MTLFNPKPAADHAPDPHLAPPIPFWVTLWEYMRPFKLSLLTAAAASFLVGIAVAVQPIIIKFIVDEGILRPNADTRERLHYALGFAALYAVIGMVRMFVWGAGYNRFMIATEGILFSIRSRFFQHIQSLCLRFHDEVSSGELFNYVMGGPIASIRQFIVSFTMSVPYQIVSWVVAAGMLAYLDWLLLLITLAIALACVWINRRSHRVIKELSGDFMRTESRASRYIADVLRGSRAIKMHSAEDRTASLFTHQIETIRFKSQHLSQQQWREGVKAEGIQYLGYALLYAVGAYSCLYRDMSLGRYFAFLNCVQLLMGPLMAMLQLNLIKANAEAGLERITRILRTETHTKEVDPQHRVTIADRAPHAAAKEWPCLEMEDVIFGYDERQPIFQRLNCRIRDGQSVALVGPSGSGKSSFVNLILRMYDPQGGMVRLYGEDIRHYALKDLRHSFGIVAQDPFFFNTTILENMRAVRPDSSDDEIRHALDMAQATEFVDRLPETWLTTIGEGAYNLSGGQRQRLAIARAILGKPRFFIFDEATAALDNQSEARIQTALEEVMKGHTTFIIAHRLSTIRNVDRILVFQDGAIIQDGSYAELAQRKGLFRTLLDRATE